MRDVVAEGLDALDRGHFFQAHELLEQRWLHSRGGERRLLQAVIQLAGACLHLERGRPTQARVLLARAGAKLEGLELSCHGITTSAVAAEISIIRASLDAGDDPLPRRFGLFKRTP